LVMQIFVDGQHVGHTESEKAVWCEYMCISERGVEFRRVLI
jgi:hypothetical protein